MDWITYLMLNFIEFVFSLIWVEHEKELVVLINQYSLKKKKFILVKESLNKLKKN